MDELKEKIADALREADSAGAFSYQKHAHAALRAIEEAGYFIRKRNQKGQFCSRCAGEDPECYICAEERPLNLEEPRG